MLRPAATVALALTVPSASLASAFSWMRMASAPVGIGAPVKMRTASSAPTVPSKWWPAADMPMIFSVAGTTGDIGGADGVAVHRGGVEGRLGAPRLQRFGERAPGSLGQRHIFG